MYFFMLVNCTEMIGKCGDKHYDVRYKVCDRCGSEPYVRPKHKTWKCCAGEKPYDTETSLCCEGNVSVLYNTHRSAKEARCCSNAAFFPDRQICCQGKFGLFGFGFVVTQVKQF